MSLHDHLFALEQQLLQTATRSDPVAVASLLADDFREFGSSGRIFTKPEMVAVLAAEVPRELTHQDFTWQHVAPAAALITYRSFSESGEALRSSLWVLRDERWQMLFHQGTMVPPSTKVEAVS